MRIVWLVLLALPAVLLVGCGQTNSPKDLYTGTQGIVMSIQNAPSINTVFFDRADTALQGFDIMTKLDNKGSSYSLGRVFISGYDRSMIEVIGENYPPYVVGSFPCSFEIGKEDKTWDVSANCKNPIEGILDIFFQGSSDSASFGGTFDLGKLLGKVFGIDDLDVLLQIKCESRGNDLKNCNFALGRDVSLEESSHGRLMSLYLMRMIQMAGSKASERWFNTDMRYVIEGRTWFNPVGGLDERIFRVKIKKEGWPENMPETTQQFLLTNCYGYATYATPTVCVDVQPYDSGRKVCRAGVVSLSSQGAPVAITSISQEATPKKIFFTINVKHVGTGRVYKLEELYKCDPWSYSRVTERDLNVVALHTVLLGGSKLNDDNMVCVPSNREVRLDNGIGSITCAYTFPPDSSISRNAYQTPLTVEVWYGYEESVQVPVLIKRIG